ncbi:MAG: hypothetical protein U9Q96_03035 [Patescibacteria group bacterium]|nr:hypothetical protein [Patescibacteria group bacterium]
MTTNIIPSPKKLSGEVVVISSYIIPPRQYEIKQKKRIDIIILIYHPERFCFERRKAPTILEIEKDVAITVQNTIHGPTYTATPINRSINRNDISNPIDPKIINKNDVILVLVRKKFWLIVQCWAEKNSFHLG